MEFQFKDGAFSGDLPFGKLNVSGDDSKGFRPYQLLTSSIGVCSAGVLLQILTKMRMELEDVKVRLKPERNEEEANRIETINIHFIIKGKDLDEEKIKKVMPLVDKHCSMIQSVKDAINIKKTYEVI